MGRLHPLVLAALLLTALPTGVVLAHPPHVIPRVIVCYGAVPGALSPAIIRRVAAQHRPQVRYCYTRQLIAHPQLAGRVTVHFVIAAGGTVKSAVLASSDLGSAAVESCVVDDVRHWSFPEVVGGSPVIVEYPFRFESVRQ